MAIGSVWASGTWGDLVWADGSWADVGDPPVSDWSPVHQFFVVGVDKMTSYNLARAITKSDTVDIVQPGTQKVTDAVYVGGAGVVVAVFPDDSTVSFTAVAGQILPIGVKRVNSTSTTATLMVALYD
jgi:hypothetical protein